MIRLADREGHLRGKKLSTIQRFCGRVMLYLEQRDRTQGELDAIKRSLLTAAAEPAKAGPILFPDYFQPEEWTADTNVRSDHGFRVNNMIRDSDVDAMLAMMGLPPREPVT
jgi:hypothetical protein